MSERNLHAKAFDEGTQEKLNIYREYLREWLPVFLHAKMKVSRIQIFDFFAGPGVDVEGKAASPIIALEEIHAAVQMARKHGNNPPAIDLYLNEFSLKKYETLTGNIKSHSFVGDVNVTFGRYDFPDAFNTWYPLMNRPGVANFLFLDQNGVKQVSTTIFKMITSLKYTDYMFYIASSIVNRFKTDPRIIEPLPITDQDLLRMNGTNVHGVIKDAYQRVAPKCYMAPFSIRKRANVYGLIFGAEHLLGLDKFLSICWKLDTVHGLANFDVENESIDPNAPSLFAEMDKPKKLDLFERDLSALIRAKKIKTNHQIYEFTLRSGFLPAHARKALKSMMDEAKIPKQKIPVSRECMKDAPVILKLDLRR